MVDKKKYHHLQQMPGLTLGEWGPGAWNTLHVFAHSAPDRLTQDEMQQMAMFLNTFASYLPCPTCRRHFKEFLSRRMTTESLRTRTTIIKLLNDAHNEVNARTGKRVYSLKEHYQIYSFKRRRGPNIRSRDVVIAVIVAIVVVRVMRRVNMHT
mgnify:CR=1 FL=1